MSGGPVVVDVESWVAAASTGDLVAAHDALDATGVVDNAAVQAHHLVAVELVKRGVPHGHSDDSDWGRAVILVDQAVVKSVDDLGIPEGMEPALTEALADGGTVSVLLTTNGYVLKGEPSVNTVHVDSIMGDEDEDDEEEFLKALTDDDKAQFAALARALDQDGDTVEKKGNPEPLRQYWREGGGGRVPWGAGGDFTACVAAVSNYMDSEQAKGYCANRHYEVNGFWPGDKRNLAKHGSHDQSTHGNWAGGGGSSYGGYALNDPANPSATGRPGDAVSAAQRVRAAAADAEPAITREVIDIANDTGGTMEGLDYRLKAEKSLARKVDDERGQHDGDVEKTADSMSDVVRYTMTFDDAAYLGGVDAALAQMEAQGYSMRVKNYWTGGDPYQGINVAVTHPNGTKFELQFHTPQSLAAKDPIHAHYETYRSSRDNRVRWTAYYRMTRMASKIPTPPGNILSLGEAKFQGFQTWQEALGKAAAVTRWFVRVGPQGVFRLDVSDSTVEAWWWNGTDWVDDERDLLVGYLVSGDQWLDEVTEQQLRDLLPAAFTDPRPIGGGGVSKAVGDERFTLGPMYIPDRLDAHAEWTDTVELQKAVWEYVRKGDRRIRLQHDRDKVAGEWVEVMTWPFPVDAPMIRKDSTVQETFPEGTVFLGVVWEPWAWEMVKSQKITGYSIGGRADRLYVDLEGE